MYKKLLASLLALLLLTLTVGCSDDDDNGVNNDIPNTTTAPADLVATGSLGNINLVWTASTGDINTYQIYRGTDGTNFSKINDSSVIINEYDDTTVTDGTVYYYRVTAYNEIAVGNEETLPSNIVKEIAGTRLQPLYSDGLDIPTGALDPYVIEDTVVVNGGSVVIHSGAHLYVKDGAVLDFEFLEDTSDVIHVNGSLYVVADADSHATITCHLTGRDLDDGEGYRLWFDTASSYDPVADTGCLIQNIEIKNLGSGNDAIRCLNSSPRFYNCKISANKLNGGAYFEIKGSSAPMIHYSTISNIVLAIRNDWRSTQAFVTRNLCRDGYYSLYFGGQDNPCIDDGQIHDNDFDGSVHGLYLNGMSGDYVIPLGNNYWLDGVPTIVKSPDVPTVMVSFSPELGTPPVGCGASW